MPELGRIKGEGTGTSDSIKTRLAVGDAIIPANVVQELGADFFKKLIMVAPDNEQGEQGETVTAKVSNGEVRLPASVVQFFGEDFINKLIGSGGNAQEEHGEIPAYAQGITKVEKPDINLLSNPPVNIAPTVVSRGLQSPSQPSPSVEAAYQQQVTARNLAQHHTGIDVFGNADPQKHANAENSMQLIKDVASSVHAPSLQEVGQTARTLKDAIVYGGERMGEGAAVVQSNIANSANELAKGYRGNDTPPLATTTPAQPTPAINPVAQATVPVAQPTKAVATPVSQSTANPVADAQQSTALPVSFKDLPTGANKDDGGNGLVKYSDNASKSALPSLDSSVTPTSQPKRLSEEQVRQLYRELPADSFSAAGMGDKTQQQRYDIQQLPQNRLREQPDPNAYRENLIRQANQHGNWGDAARRSSAMDQLKLLSGDSASNTRNALERDTLNEDKSQFESANKFNYDKLSSDEKIAQANREAPEFGALLGNDGNPVTYQKSGKQPAQLEAQQHDDYSSHATEQIATTIANAEKHIKNGKKGTPEYDESLRFLSNPQIIAIRKSTLGK
jgi:hypothetical protein